MMGSTATQQLLLLLLLCLHLPAQAASACQCMPLHCALLPTVLVKERIRTGVRVSVLPATTSHIRVNGCVLVVTGCKAGIGSVSGAATRGRVICSLSVAMLAAAAESQTAKSATPAAATVSGLAHMHACLRHHAMMIMAHGHGWRINGQGGTGQELAPAPPGHGSLQSACSCHAIVVACMALPALQHAVQSCSWWLPLQLSARSAHARTKVQCAVCGQGVPRGKIIIVINRTWRMLLAACAVPMRCGAGSRQGWQGRVVWAGWSGPSCSSASWLTADSTDCCILCAALRS